MIRNEEEILKLVKKIRSGIASYKTTDKPYQCGVIETLSWVLGYTDILPIIEDKVPLKCKHPKKYLRKAGGTPYDPWFWECSKCGQELTKEELKKEEVNMSRAFYSIIQYCPDAFRAESVNVGLVLLHDNYSHEIRVDITKNLNRVKRFFKLTKDDLINLQFSMDGIVSRIQNTEAFKTEDEMKVFADSRGNDLIMTSPRLAKIDDIETDFRRLFCQLVEEPVLLK